MPNYDLYTELELDKDMPPTEIGQLLDDRIGTLTGQGYQQNSPEVDQLATARAILSDPAKRDAYEAALAGPDGVVDVSWLHNLADAPSAAAVADRSSGPSYDAASTSVIDAGSVGAGDRDTGSAAGSQGAQYGTPGALHYGAQPSFGPSGSAGADGTGFSSGNFSAPAASSPVKPQFNATSLSVAGRTRSQSKAYLACLAIIVVGMLYPLVILFTAGKDDVDAIYSILKATMFTFAHTAAWLAIAEIVWGVRRIVAPEQTPTDAASSDVAPAEN